MTRAGSAICTRRRASSACSLPCLASQPSNVNDSISCGPIRSDGFSAEPGSWYTIDAVRARNSRRAAPDMSVTLAPANDTDPPEMRPFEGR